MPNGESQTSDRIPADKPAEVVSIEKQLAKIVPEKEKQSQIISLFRQITVHAGPLPSPDTLKKYNQLIRNGAERIMKMAENQQSHRIESERKIIDGKIEEGRRGQIFGLTIAIVALAIAAVLSIYGHEAVAGIIGGTTVVGLVTVFVVGQGPKEKKEPDS